MDYEGYLTTTRVLRDRKSNANIVHLMKKINYVVI